MIIPNAHLATVDIRKLRDYCLNPHHDDGKHKARLFWAKLGLTADDAHDLQITLLKIVQTHDAKLGRRDAYGQRYQIDFEMTWQDKRAIIRSGWLIEHDTGLPKLTTCYPL